MSETLLYCCRDAWGEIRVWDTGSCRRLAFGPGDEQSLCLKANPAQLLFDYTQAMLLPLLFAEPRRLLCLGLGAGSLITTLHGQLKALKSTAVELRPAVIEAAQRFFYLPAGRRVRLICQDAAEFVRQDQEHYDWIFSDLYSAQGLCPLQLCPDFLSDCAARLKPNGWLIINFWGEDSQRNELLTRLRPLFQELRGCLTGEGNWVLLAALQPQRYSQRSLRLQARDWSLRLGYPLHKHLNRLESL